MGIGGAFVLTPALNALGIPMTYAVGTGLTFTIGVSSYGSYKHIRAGNASFKAVMIISSICLIGIYFSHELVVRLESLHQADAYIRFVYIVMLFVVGIATYRGNSKSSVSKEKTVGTEPNRPIFKGMPPFIMLENGKQVSFWGMVFIGLVVGFLQGFMGVGGGFILVPFLLWLLDMQPHWAVGTSLLSVFFSSLYAAALYLYSGRVLLPIAAVLILASLVGANFGVKAMQRMKGEKLTRYFALFLIFNSLGVALKQIGLETAALVYTLSLTGGAALFVLYTLWVRRANED